MSSFVDALKDEFADLFDELPDPPKRVALPGSETKLVNRLRGAAAHFEHLANLVEQYPFADSVFDDWNRLTAGVIEQAREDLVKFRQTRDCASRA